MADLNELQATGITKLIGSDASANEQTPVQSTASGGLHVNLRDNAGTELATTANPAIVAGPGVAGTPAGGVLSIQGVAGGTAVPSSQSGVWTTGRTWTLASGTDSVSAVQSGTWNITNISGTISLPTGASTSANQATEITALQLIDNPVGSVTAGTAGTSSFLIGGIFNTALPTLTNGQQSAIQFDSSARIIIAPLTSSSVITSNQGTANTHANAWFIRLTDGTDDSGITPNGDLQTSDIINIAGQHRSQSITISAAEALGAATILSNRKSLTVTPTNGTIYWGYANTVTTSTGTPIFKNQTVSWNIGSNVHVYLIAGSTIDSRITEGS